MNLIEGLRKEFKVSCRTVISDQIQSFLTQDRKTLTKQPLYGNSENLEERVKSFFYVVKYSVRLS